MWALSVLEGPLSMQEKSAGFPEQDTGTGGCQEQLRRTGLGLGMQSGLDHQNDQTDRASVHLNTAGLREERQTETEGQGQKKKSLRWAGEMSSEHWLLLERTWISVPSI